jgi:hypothetical protein
MAWLAAVVAMAAPGCASCSDREERRLAHWVEIICGEPGPTADLAEEALVAAGAAAILYLETGLYEAEPAARGRIARVLARLRDPAARPILAHLAEHDPDPDVASEAEAGLRSLEGRSQP